jgi:hypothetical protein
VEQRLAEQNLPVTAPGHINPTAQVNPLPTTKSAMTSGFITPAKVDQAKVVRDREDERVMQENLRVSRVNDQKRINELHILITSAQREYGGETNVPHSHEYWNHGNELRSLLSKQKTASSTTNVASSNRYPNYDPNSPTAA